MTPVRGVAPLALVLLAIGCFSPNTPLPGETDTSNDTAGTETGVTTSMLSLSSTQATGEEQTTSSTSNTSSDVESSAETGGEAESAISSDSTHGSTAGGCPCEADTRHCVGVCRDGTCMIEAADVDEDGFGSSRCDAAPGEDCDDARADVFPGAPESCDGIDSDCDGREDIEEAGHELEGQVVEIDSTAYVDKATAYSRELDLVGFVYSHVRDGVSAQRFVTIRGDGEVSSEVEIASSLASSGSLAAGHGGFGYAYVLQGVGFRRIEADGDASEEETITSSTTGLGRTSVVAVPDGWIVAWRQEDTVWVRRMQSDGTAVGDAVEVGVADARYAGPSMGVVGERVLIAFASVNDGVLVRPYSFDLVVAGDARRIAPAPALNPTVSGNAVVFTDGGFVRFGLLNEDGGYECGPVTVSTDLSNRFDADSSAAPAEYPGGHLVAYVDGQQGGRVALARVHEACEVRDSSLLVHDTGRQQGNVELVSGASVVVATWREPSLPAGYYRTFGIHLCNEPS